MKTFWKTAVAVAAVAALGAAGCEQRNDERSTSERLEEDARGAGERLEEGVEGAGERIEQAGEDLRNGVTYEVAKIDEENRTIELRRSNVAPGVTDEKDLQAGESLKLTFDELRKHVGGDKSAEEIADELHVGENVDVFMDENRKIEKITY